MTVKSHRPNKSLKREPLLRTEKRGRPSLTESDRKRPPAPGQLLFTRWQSALTLGMSVSSVVRMEKRGILRTVRPTGSLTGQVFHPQHDILRIAQARGGSDVEA